MGRMCVVWALWIAGSSVGHAQWFGRDKNDERRVRSEIMIEARTHLGKPYRWNQSGPDEFDCSGYVYYVLKTALGTDRFPLAYALNKMKGYRNQSVYYRDWLASRGGQIRCEDAAEGDVIFFRARKDGENNHIGLISNPRLRYFITAQGLGSGVAEHSYAQGSYWQKRPLECYRNLWLKKGKKRNLVP